MDNGLGRRRTDSETAAQVSGRGGGWLINRGVCRHAVTLPTGCSWIKEHLDPPTPPPIDGPPLVGAAVSPGMVRPTAKADGKLFGTGRALDERG